MEPIGGYFSLELRKGNNFPQSGGFLLNTNRNALEFLLRMLGNARMVYLPFFTCFQVFYIWTCHH